MSLFRTTALGFILALAAVPAAAQQPIEPIDIPPSIEQGVDMLYVDPEIAERVRMRTQPVSAPGFEDWTGAPLDMFTAVHPFYTELRRGLVRYQQRWGSLPQVEVPAGPALKLGSSGERVARLRERLGVTPGDKFDATLATVVKDYQRVHGLKDDGIVAGGTIASLNLGARHYERLIIVNLERARRLPTADEGRRYILVDAGAAKLWMYENGVPVDSMNVVVGTKATETPMLAALLRYVSLNPYWNVPPELAANMVAKNVLAQGLTYLSERDYEVLSDWTDDAKVLDPATIDWQAVREGRSEIKLRRKPGPWNSMGAMKFMLPNDYGIYLHDVPDKEQFKKDERWTSNGCIRLEDAKRLATWLFGDVPEPRTGEPEEQVDLPEPVAVYMTYLTVGTTKDGIVFRPDRYDRDAGVLARYFRDDAEVAEASGG